MFVDQRLVWLIQGMVSSVLRFLVVALVAASAKAATPKLAMLRNMLLLC